MAYDYIIINWNKPFLGYKLKGLYDQLSIMDTIWKEHYSPPSPNLLVLKQMKRCVMNITTPSNMLLQYFDAYSSIALPSSTLMKQNLGKAFMRSTTPLPSFLSICYWMINIGIFNPTKHQGPSCFCCTTLITRFSWTLPTDISITI